MPIELIKPLKAGVPPVAMRFGEEIVTNDNLETFIRNTRKASAKATILGALECGLLDEKTFLDQNSRYTHRTLGVWRTMPDVAGILQEARENAEKETGTGFVLGPSDEDAVSKVSGAPQEKTYVVGKWRLSTSRNTLAYGIRETRIAPSVTRALSLLFCNPGQSVTKGVLHHALRKKALTEKDNTVGAVFHDLQKTMKALAGPLIPLEASEDGNSYRLKTSS